MRRRDVNSGVFSMCTSSTSVYKDVFTKKHKETKFLTIKHLIIVKKHQSLAKFFLLPRYSSRHFSYLIDISLVERLDEIRRTIF